jgi:peptide/nickel transport system substrate-binding protein
MEKKNIAITVLVIALIVSGVGNIVLLVMSGFVQPQPLTKILIRGTTAGPDTLEICHAWDSASNDVIDQVCEGLFAYNFSDLAAPRINELAESYWWENDVTLHLKLREGVTFHDGEIFNATSAKWNLDRLLYLTNSTGENVDAGNIVQTQSLWMFADGVSPIIHNVTIDTAYNITILLNDPYAPFLDLLTYVNAYMVSPKSTPPDSFITMSSLVGTGPYKFVAYIFNVEVRFARYEDYWQEPTYFDEMVFPIYSDPITLNNAMLEHKMDIISGADPGLLATFKADPLIRVRELTNETGLTSLVYQYIGMNNVAINTTWRKAMSYAFDYDYFLTFTFNNLGVRANSPIAPGFADAYNATNKAAVLNRTIARQIVQSMGYGVGFNVSEDAEWTAVADGSTPFLTVNYTYNSGNILRKNTGVVVRDNFRLIGINVIDLPLTWSAFLSLLQNPINYKYLSIYFVGWAPDYKDPINMLDPLFNPASTSNSAQVNDPYLTSLLGTAVATIDDTARNNIYKHIQWYLANVLYSHIILYHGKLTYVHLADLLGYAYNVMGNFDAYPCYRA